MAVFIVYFELFAAHNTAFTPSSRNNGGMACLATGSCQNTLSCMHAAYIFGTGFLANKDDFFTLFFPFLSDLCIEYHPAYCGSWNSIDTLHKKRFLKRCSIRFIDHWIENSLYIRGFDTKYRFFFSNQLFFYKIYCDAEGCNRATFSRTALQHIELTFFHGEFQILHISIVSFKLSADIDKLFVYFWVKLFELCKLYRRPNSRNNVLALSINEIITVEDIFASIWVPGKTYAGARTVTFVTKNHLNDIYGGPFNSHQLLYFSVCHGFFCHPRIEDRIDSAF